MKPKHILLWLLAIIPLCSAEVRAQLSKRVEIQTRSNADQMIVVPIGGEGVVLFSEVTSGKYTFTKYTTELKEDWSVDCMVNGSLKLSKYVFHGNSLYLFLQDFKSPMYQVVKLNTTAGFAEKFDVRSLDKLEVTDFEAIGNDAFIAGKTRNEPILMHINLMDRKTEVLPTATKGKSEIQSLEVDSARNELNVTFASVRGREHTMIIKSFAPDGQPVKSVVLESAPERSLLTGRVSPVGNDQDLVIGTYGARGSSYATSRNMYSGYSRSVYAGPADFTQGLYISKLNGDDPQFTKYYSFTDFKNFFKFMDARQQSRMEKQIKRRKDQGKDLRLQYRLLVHDIIKYNGQYVMVAEAYYPEYRNNYNSYGYPYSYGYGGFGGFYGGGYGSRYGGRAPVFDGYVYTHAVIAGFDMEGNLLWDNSFEISDVKTYDLREKVRVSFKDDNVLLAYSHGGMLKTKVIKGNDVVGGKENVPLRTDYAGDRVKRAYTDNVDYWYQNNFLAWGYQKITNQKDDQVRGKRNVFYFSKVEF